MASNNSSNNTGGGSSSSSSIFRRSKSSGTTSLPLKRSRRDKNGKRSSRSGGLTNKLKNRLSLSSSHSIDEGNSQKSAINDEDDAGDDRDVLMVDAEEKLASTVDKVTADADTNNYSTKAAAATSAAMPRIGSASTMLTVASSTSIPPSSPLKLSLFQNSFDNNNNNNIAAEDTDIVKNEDANDIQDDDDIESIVLTQIESDEQQYSSHRKYSSRRRRRTNQKIRQHNNNQQHQSSSSSAGALHHEYNVDHSCSTPLERLTRDIGNTLRQWNVHDGCDRHVSLGWIDQLSSSSSTPVSEGDTQQEVDNNDDGDAQSLMSDVTEHNDHSTTKSSTVDGVNNANTAANKEEEIVMSMDMCEQGFASRSRRINVWMGDEDNNDDGGHCCNDVSSLLPNKVSLKDTDVIITTTETSNTTTTYQSYPQSPKPASSKCTKYNNEGEGAQCIRKKKIEFQTIGFSPEVSSNDDDTTSSTTEWKRRRYTIPLVLSLWDGPCIPSTATRTKSTEEETGDTHHDFNDDDELDNNNGIPLSFRHNPSPSSYALLGELGLLSSCGTRRCFYNTDDTKESVVTSKSVAFHNNNGNNKSRRTLLQTGFGQDLSSLFNVGQHITLSLDVGGDDNNDKNVKGSGDDVQSLYNDMYAYIDEQIRLANEAYAVSQRERSLRLKKYQRKDTEKHVSSDEEEEVIDFEDNIQLQKPDSPFDDNSDTTNRMLDEESSSTYDEDEMQHKDEEESDSYEDDSSYIQDYICLNQHEMNNEVVSSLTSILHTALTLAASENDCNIPVFGIWGAYKGSSIDSGMDSGNDQVSRLVEGGQCAAPTWISPRTPQDRDETCYDEGKLFLSSPIIVGTCETSTFRSTHRVYSISQQHNLPTHLCTLDGLAKVLLGICPPNDKTQRVALTAARHCYYWNRHDGYTSNNKEEGQEWRNVGQSTGTGDNRSKLDVEVYREQCELQVLKSLERASTNPRGYFWRNASPLWGPTEGNPLLSLSASVSWGVIPSEKPSTNTVPTPLLQLPLKRRSSIAPSPAELFEMDSALQSAALNPVGVGVKVQSEVDPKEPIFFASAQFDNNSPCATLSANTRCVLAALIRCGSLGLDTLPGHLTKTDVLFSFSPRVHDVSSSGEPVLEEIPATETKLRDALRKANIGSVTERLVNALDWRDAVIGSPAAGFRIESISYPEPPADISNLYNTATSNMSTSPKGKAAPPGRLLSLLFAHMAKLRTPPSMMKLWLSFVEDLRTRWDLNESLPNLGSVPGLDIYHGDKRQHQSNLSLNQSDRKGLGHLADLAAFVNSSEPEPSREHCLVNQKLQVFNICIECKVSTDRMWEKKMKEGNNDVVISDDMSSEDDEDFFDAPSEEYVSFDQDDHNVEEMLKRRATNLPSPTSGHSRVGARCPVPTAMPLIESGDQVYAPYLQRMMPMTDEEEGKQKKLFGVDGENGEVRLPIQERIKIMQHLQKPKLISDMASFKAANRGAVFEDFVRWYGNPENPLGEEISSESLRRDAEIRSKLSPQQAKALALNEASEAISLLMNLRAFWEDSWDESEAEAAFEQDPLFDPYTTVEMLLHSFETIHPALLMNQVLAVNLCNAKFVLTAASKQAVQVRTLAEGLHNLNVSIDLALESLANDASKEVAPNTADENSTPLTYVTTETISKCEEACNQIGEFEITLSRSLALLEKLHDNYNLVDSLLQCCTDANFVLVKDPKDRDAFLGVIRSGQMANTTIDPSSFFPDACMREYVMSNNNRMNPCHLNARLMSSTRGSSSSFSGSLLLALSQSTHE